MIPTLVFNGNFDFITILIGFYEENMTSYNFLGLHRMKILMKTKMKTKMKSMISYDCFNCLDFWYDFYEDCTRKLCPWRSCGGSLEVLGGPRRS